MSWVELAILLGVVVAAALLLTVIFMLKRLSGSNNAFALKDPQTVSQSEFVKVQSALTRLSFTEALSNLNIQLSSHAPDGMNLVINSLRLGGAGLEVELSEAGRHLLQGGKAYIPIHKGTGRLLPQIQAKDGGKITELMKEVPRAKQWVSRLSALSSLAVSTAHIVAGHDQLKRLQAIQKNTQFLLAARKVDQLARLETAYLYSRELLSRPLTPASRGELAQQYRTLIELRSQWRQELEYKLARIDDPGQAALLTRWFTRRKTMDRQVLRELSEGEVEISLIEFSLVMSIALAEAIGTTEVFLSMTLPSELDQLKRLAPQLREKAKYISGRSEREGITADPILERFEMLDQQYAAFVIPQGDPGKQSTGLPPAAV